MYPHEQFSVKLGQTLNTNFGCDRYSYWLKYNASLKFLEQ